MPAQTQNHRTRNRRFIPALLLCGFAFHGAAACASAPAPAESIQQVFATTERIELRESNSLLLDYPDWLTQVRSQNPSVIRIDAVRPNRLRVTRIGTGTSLLQAIDCQDRLYTVEVIVVRAAAEGR